MKKKIPGDNSPWPDYDEIASIPFDVMYEFVARVVRNRRISRLEKMSAGEVLEGIPASSSTP